MSTALATSAHHPDFVSCSPPAAASVFSVSSVVHPSSDHLPHTAHPIPLREQAFALHCQGLRSPAIAQALGVPERTIRAWIAAALVDLKDDLQLSRKEQLLLAVERQHQITASAWQQFGVEAAARDALLDAALNTLLSASTAPSEHAGASPRPLHLHLPASTPAPRYLSLILQANKETNRLLGLHTLARLQLLTPDSAGDDSIPLAYYDIPAESATGSSSLGADPVGASTRLSNRADCSNPEIPAESATASDSPPPVGEGLGVGSPAKTANPTAPGLAAGIQPANLRPTVLSPSLASDHAAGSPLLRGEGLGERSPAKTATATNPR